MDYTMHRLICDLGGELAAQQVEGLNGSVANTGRR
jgi:hypothetical protein